MRKTMLALFAVAFVSLVAFTSVASAEDPGNVPWWDRPLGTVGPLGKVGPLGTVGPLGKDKDYDLRLPADLKARPIGAVACWTWNVATDPTWRCTGKYEEDLRKANDFAWYKKEKYLLGEAFVVPVLKKDWDNAEARKKIMERVKIEAIPEILERLAKKEDVNNPERAAKIRKQISFIKTDWVDVKPSFAKDRKEYKELRAGKVQASKKIGFDDDAPKGNALAGTVWETQGNRTEFKSDGTLIFSYGKYDDKGKWTPTENGFTGETVHKGPNNQTRREWKGTLSDGQLKMLVKTTFEDGTGKVERAYDWLEWSGWKQIQN